MTTRREYLGLAGLSIAALAGCAGDSDGAGDDPESTSTTVSSTTTASPVSTSTATETASTGDAASDLPLLPVADPNFLAAADETLADAAAESGTGALYLEIVNDQGTTHYATNTHTNLAEVSVNVNGMLVFRTGGMMSHSFGVHDPFVVGPRACVDDTEYVSTSGYDVFGFKMYQAPNSLKPYAADACQFEISEDGGVYTGLGTARAHFYTYSDGYHERRMRFKYVYRE